MFVEVLGWGLVWGFGGCFEVFSVFGLFVFCCWCMSFCVFCWFLVLVLVLWEGGGILLAGV
jgi:hypothetical protein